MWSESNIVTEMKLLWAALACALLCGLSGCRHKPVVPPLPPISQPVALVAVPEPQPMLQEPEIELPPVPLASGAHPRRERRRRLATTLSGTGTATPSTQPAEDSAATVSPEDAAIGSLSLGGEANPRVQQEATELIASNERRLNGLHVRNATERTQISRIRNFQRQAQGALKSGDVEGARTLATKAKLLLDDLER